MPVSIVVGLQWGDEGKGKMIDHLAADAVAVARFSGGANAGHTIETNGKKIALHLIPSGLLRENVLGFIGAACVMDPVSVLEEIRLLHDNGFSVGDRLKISGKVHLTHPAYRLFETHHENLLAQRKIGTTGRGIGPTYERKFQRNGIRLEDVFDESLFGELVDFHTNQAIKLLQLTREQTETLHSEVLEFSEAARKVAEYSQDVSLLLNRIILSGGLIIAEGAQGSLLDPDHGSYPFVTCGQCVSGTACTSLGIGPTMITDVVGILKAYSTRVGSGPFPTELNNETGERIRKAGHEFGTTTGRPRRCGWLDGVLARYAARINGCTSITVTLLDVLSGFDELKICTSYTGGTFASGRAMYRMQPEYITLPGWKEDIAGMTEWKLLPEAARQYVLKIEEIVGIPVTAVSTGPGRDDLIWRR